MLELDPTKRITANNALEHPFFKESHYPLRCQPNDLPKIEKDSHEFQSRQQKHQDKERQKQVAPQQGNNPQFNNKHGHQQKGAMMVARQGYNPNYYSKSSSNKQNEQKIRIDESHNQVTLQGGSLLSNFQPSSRLEALINPNITSDNLLNNKRQTDNTLEQKDGQSYKKQRSEQEHLSPANN